MGGGSSRQAAAPKAKPKAKTAANKKASEKPKPKAEVKAAPTKQRKNKKAKDEKLGEEPVELIAVAEVEDTTAEPEEPVEEQVVQETGDVIQVNFSAVLPRCFAKSRYDMAYGATRTKNKQMAMHWRSKSKRR